MLWNSPLYEPAWFISASACDGLQAGFRFGGGIPVHVSQYSAHGSVFNWEQHHGSVCARTSLSESRVPDFPLLHILLICDAVSVMFASRVRVCIDFSCGLNFLSY